MASLAKKLKYLTVNPKSGNHLSSLIFAHGLGDTGEGWKDFALYLQQLPAFRNLRIILPHAPVLPLVTHGGYPLPAWYNIYSAGPFPRVRTPESKEDVVGFMESVGSIKQLVDDEINTQGIPADKVVLGGFSQGAAITLASAATYKDVKLGGFIALSGFCPIEKHLESLISNTNVDTPIFQGHGSADPIISHQYGVDAYSYYKKHAGFRHMAFKSYAGLEHTTCPAEVADMVSFLKKIV